MKRVFSGTPLLQLECLKSNADPCHSRVSGRSSHVSRLRADFDQGVDYNLVECDPCDVDPHVIASLFKQYLRECG